MSRYSDLMNAIAEGRDYLIDGNLPDPVEVCVLMLIDKMSIETFGILSMRANMSSKMIDRLFVWKDARSTLGIEEDECILAALLIVASARNNVQLIVLLLPSLLNSTAFQDIGPLLPNNILLYIVFMRNKTLGDNMKDKIVAVNILRSDDYIKNVLMIMEKYIGRKDYLRLFEIVESDFMIPVYELPQDMIDIYLQYVAYTLNADEFIKVVNNTTGTGLNYDINFCPDPYLIIFKDRSADLFRMIRTFISMKVIVVSSGYVYWNFNTLICNMILKTFDKINVSNINLVPRNNGQDELKTMIEKYKVLGNQVTNNIDLVFSGNNERERITPKDIDEIFGLEENIEHGVDHAADHINDLPKPEKQVSVVPKKMMKFEITDLTRKTGIRARRDAKRRNMRK